VLNALKNFLHKLKEGGLYDDTIVLFHCGMAYAAKHTNKKAPAFLFGGGFNHKESIACLNGKEHIYSTSDLFTSILQQSGFNNKTFSNSKQVIPDLFKA
jgi:hypothetical protein